MSRLVIETSATALAVGPMMIVVYSMNGQMISWTTAIAGLAVLMGAAGIATACRRSAPVEVRAKRIIVLILLGLLVPLLCVSTVAAATLNAWGIAAGAALATVLIAFGLTRITSLDVSSWVTAEREMTRETSQE